MVNWSDPTLATLYTQVLTDLNNKDIDAATMFIGSASTNIPTNAIRLSSAGVGTLERWSGAAWVAQALRLEGAVTLRLPLDPRIQFYDESELLDEKRWDVLAQGSSFFIRAYNDAASVAVNPVSITRTGTVIDIINLAATTVAVTGNITVTGTVDGIDVAAHAGDVSIHTEDNLLAHLAGVETFTADKHFDEIFVNELNNQGGNFLIVNVGESKIQATAQTAEILYVNAEGGLQINSSPDNWVSLWAGRDTATICGAGGNSTFPGNVGVTGNITVTGTVDGVDVAAHAALTNTAHGAVSTATASTIMARNGSGYAFAVYFNASSALENTTAGSYLYQNTGADGYLRKKSLTNVRTEIVTAAAVNAVATTASTINTAVKRDSAGDINARLFRSEYDSTNATINYIMTQVDTVSNNYVRPSTPAQFRASVTAGTYATISHTHAQIDLNANSVGQSQVKIAEQAVAINSSDLYVNATGAEYVMGFEIDMNTGAGSRTIASIVAQSDNASLLYRYYFASNGSGPSACNIHYINGSPPYDMGNGNIHQFVYAVVDNSTGELVWISASRDPIWMHNGPTKVRTSRKAADGRIFRSRRDMSAYPLTFDQSMAAGGTAVRDYTQAYQDAPFIEEEITQALKMADMNVIPHPFIGNDMTGRTAILLDPVSPIMRRLKHMSRHDTASVLEIVSKYLTIGNTGLDRVGPAGLLIPSIQWKLT